MEDKGMYGQEVSLREKIVTDYRADLERLLRYLPYLDKKSGKDVQSFYDTDATFESIPVPVYDSTLLAFVKEVRKTKFIYRNYPYTYRKYHLSTPADERDLMEKAALRDIDIFRSVISRYIIEGQTKAFMWSKGVDERIFVTALDTLQRLFTEFDAQLKGKGINH